MLMFVYVYENKYLSEFCIFQFLNEKESNYHHKSYMWPQGDIAPLF